MCGVPVPFILSYLCLYIEKFVFVKFTFTQIRVYVWSGRENKIEYFSTIIHSSWNQYNSSS